MPTATRSRRLTREDWVAEALESLREEGVERVRVEPLARRLGVTKGSFYGHFRDRQDLLESVLQYWEKKTNHEVGEMLASIDGEARQRLLALMTAVVIGERGRYDTAIRAWAAHDDTAMKFVRRVDRWRHRLAADLFKAMGFEADEAKRRGRGVDYFLLGEQNTPARGTRSERQALVERVHELFTRPAPKRRAR